RAGRRAAATRPLVSLWTWTLLGWSSAERGVPHPSSVHRHPRGHRPTARRGRPADGPAAPREAEPAAGAETRGLARRQAWGQPRARPVAPVLEVAPVVLEQRGMTGDEHRGVGAARVALLGQDLRLKLLKRRPLVELRADEAVVVNRRVARQG